MQPSVGRLKRRADFLRVAGTGRKCAEAGLVLQAADRREPDESDASMIRVGFTASRKVGSSVARNRARRRLKAAADRVLVRHAATGRDFVLIARGATLTRPFAALVGDLETALRRLGLWREESEK